MEGKIIISQWQDCITWKNEEGQLKNHYDYNNTIR